MPREVNSRSRAAYYCLVFKINFKNKDLLHIFSANLSAEKIRLSKMDFFDSLTGRGIPRPVFVQSLQFPVAEIV